MYKRYKAVILAMLGVLTLSLNVQASGIDNEKILDSSMSDEENSSEATELFDWNFETYDAGDEVAPLGVYFAVGHASIKKKSSTSVYILASTDCYQKCTSVVAVANLQKLVDGTWRHVTDRNKTGSNVSSITADGTVSVSSGYYYRVVSFHNATKNGKTEYGSCTTRSLLVN